MEYQVPQFIEVEDKIVGPLTLKQFIYVAGAAGLIVVFYVYLPLYLTVVLALPVIALAAGLSFYKVNGKPLIEMLEAGFTYYTGAKLFLWKHEEPKAAAPVAAPEAAARPVARPVARLTSGKLSQLAWSLDVESAPNPSDTEH